MTATSPQAPPTLDGLLAEHAAARPGADALVLPGPLGFRRVTFAALERRVDAAAGGLLAAGVGPGTRTALLVPPVADFFVLAYALLRVRAVPVVVDPGIGLDRVRACLGEAAPEAFVGVAKAHLARRVLRWCPDAWVAVGAGPVPVPGALSLRRLEREGARRGPFAPVARPTGTPAAILFTSGSTGPPKGVEHHEDGLLAQAGLVRDLYGLGPGDVSLATFPPFALFGPALGMTTVVPRMDPTKPAKVVPARLVRAARRTGATVMFGSPAVLDRLGRGAPAGTRLPTLRQVISAGAPVPRDVQRRVLALLDPGAQVHTPYGATEALPVASVGSDELLDLPDDGICVGRPVPGVDVALVRPTDGPIEELTPDRHVAPGEVGEVVVRGPVVSPAYADRPAATAAAKLRWDGSLAHRMGDLASADAAGRLWFAGRVSHVVHTAGGPLHSVPCEEVLNRHPAVRRTALVGVGPDGDRRPVAVVEMLPGHRLTPVVADELRALAADDARTRSITTLLEHPGLPVDPRHNSKIDREALGRWAAGELA
ncbi:fatty acid CoA ligase family protein [Actinomycetospora cinnamomea]|uniref:Acyl-CoA synthetase (AMP-forming)/AMP-acid ligase II n=1 Tax=Actinomycetospora cinnamomea TaxID=663609 RepID=A0A2U1FQ08_9PSEU|nr:fatty acid CoA ligase family protein [Actinomycetospora cinnamomea]PVZ14226.1 acyl-CoA synthetase (AMP-forming)/AMP-acid ligase II [Actinomycetospora cinnamomea]